MPGDCCECECGNTEYNDDSMYSGWCGLYGYDCEDPYASTDCESDVGYGNDDASCSYNGDGYCDSSYNTAECDYDGGESSMPARSTGSLWSERRGRFHGMASNLFFIVLEAGQH